MKSTWNKYLFAFLLLAAVLSACSQEASPTPTEQAAATAPISVAEEVVTDTPEPVEPTATATVEPTPTETQSPTNTPEPKPTEEVIAEIGDECLACHSDKDRLIDTAASEEKVPSESSGVG